MRDPAALEALGMKMLFAKDGECVSLQVIHVLSQNALVSPP
jgi:hypothetical protein